MALRFNSTDDEEFADLANHLVIAGTNPIADLQPSSLNLTNCWVIHDLLVVREHPEDGDYYSRFRTLSNDFRTLLPIDRANVDPFSIYEYYLIVQNLPTFLPVLSSSLSSCNATDGLRTPVSQVDFIQNCSATGDFWSQYVYGSQKPDGESASALFQNSLLTPFATMNDRTLVTLGSDALSYHNGLVSMHEPLRAPFQDMLVQAAKTCAPSACSALDFPGNADIAGIGVSLLVV